MMSGADPLYLNMAAASAKMRGLRLSAVLPKPCRKHQVADLLKTFAASPWPDRARGWRGAPMAQAAAEALPIAGGTRKLFIRRFQPLIVTMA
jgi:hypothetical protein